MTVNTTETPVNSIGVSGSRDPLTPEQEHAFYDLMLQQVRKGATELHHGGCTGADSFAHFRMITMPGVWTHVHPATGVDAKYANTDFLMRHIRRIDHEPKPTAERNQDIVDACDVLIAAPRFPEDDERSKRSGTWQTVRKADAAGKPVWIAESDGSTHPYEGKKAA